MKKIEFMGDSLEIIRGFSKETSRDIGYQLDMIQRGEMPNDWKPMKTIGPGVKEIRVKNRWGAFRTVYVIEGKQGLVVLHAFEKKTQKTSKKDIGLAKSRLKILKERK